MVEILLMDDEEDFTSVLVETLADAGHNTTVARSASEALLIIQSQKFDILITDLMVYEGKRPVPNGGISLISKLRNPVRGTLEPWVMEMPIIAISGKINYPGMTDMLKTAQSIGADMALGKPTDTQDLLHAIRVLTKRKPDSSEG